MNILDKRATNPAAALDGTELVYVAQLGDDAVTTVQDIQDFATKDTVYIPNSTDPFPLTTKTLYMIGDFITTTYGDLYLQLPPLTASTIIEVQLAFNIEEVGHVYLTPSGTDLIFGEGTPFDLKILPIAPGCTVKLFFHSVGLGWIGQANYSNHLIYPKIHPLIAASWAAGHRIVSESTGEKVITVPDADVNLGKLTNSTVAPSDITVTASPFTYQNTTAFNGDVIISGGTVSDIEFTRDNTTFYTVGFIEGVLRLSPSDRVRVTYTVAPTMTYVPR